MLFRKDKVVELIPVNGESSKGSLLVHIIKKDRFKMVACISVFD